MLVLATGWLLTLGGLALLAGGFWLLFLGGSLAYAIIGLGLLLCGILLLRRRAAALAVYSLVLLFVIVWGLWEVGLDRWALIPRGAMLAVIGLWLLTPWIARRLGGGRVPAAERKAWHAPRTSLAVAMLAVVAVALASMWRDPFEISGTVPRIDSGTALHGAAPAADDWPVYGGNAFGQRYSALADITPRTIERLKHAWTFHTGDVKRDADPSETTFEVTPIKVGDTLYVCTPHSWLIALDAGTGKERWRHDPKVQVTKRSQHLTCRGVAYHDSGTPDARCARRVLLPTIDARLIALDAATGQPCTDFGTEGTVDLKANVPNLRDGNYMVTSPPAVTRDLVIVGSAINDNVSVDNPSGVIRAFDIRTGRLVWNWEPANPGNTAPIAAGAMYAAGGPNSWSISSVDEVLGLVYLPMANRSPDLIGTNRSEAVERFTSSVVALELASGRVRWVFQTLHHDLWDRDVPSQPTLVDITVAGNRVPALVAPTKQGDVFVLNRLTGEPLLPVRQVQAPAGAVGGDRASPKQPHSALSFLPPPLQGKDMWGATPWDQLLCRIHYRSMRYEGPYTPPSTQQSLVYPGNTGVFNWGSVAVDPVRQVLFGSPVRLAFTHRLVPRAQPDSNLVSDGVEPFNENYGGAYAFDMGPFTSPLGIPCQQPPWGALAAADLRTGEVAWRRRNGTVRDSMPLLPIPLPMGVPSLGGPMVTAGGVMFFSGTLDNYLRAYDASTGRKLWEARLPAGGQSTPMTYRASGRQMVVVAAGGHGTFGTELGDAVVAYALE